MEAGSSRARGRGRGRGRGRAWHYAAGKRNSADEILENTVMAMADLKRQISEEAAGLEADKPNGLLKDAELWSCRINAGLFGVEWERSKSVLADSMLDIKVVSPPPE
ncbi:uncharacterized protein GIQ15_03851 [Arthroderma uncinatum]|uniref:uncharacterized protein n=1 Tax=Arthroderma uncinatum TaxID=74035 RepID=UPI00144AEAF8|nr:uncharacterized protein GIQ15_03851 [Arthroderma uncinatum]KAF3481092.1 hypothetical protein GIQ15_03851 [Arthroderma uncinatum]